MTDKAVVSSYTYRPVEDLRRNVGDLPVFELPQDLPQLFRPTSRKTRDRLYVDSLAVIAKYEEDFRDFLEHAKECKAQIVSREDDRTFVVNGNCENLVKWWKDARRKGAGKLGGEIAAKAKRAAVAERAKGLTREEWTNSNIKNAQLVGKYNSSINALKRYASDKGWGHDRQRAIWRAEQRRKK